MYKQTIVDFLAERLKKVEDESNSIKRTRELHFDDVTLVLFSFASIFVYIMK